jgi:hypothetical protein
LDNRGFRSKQHWKWNRQLYSIAEFKLCQKWEYCGGGSNYIVNQYGGAPPIEIIRAGGKVTSADNKPARGALVTFTNSTTGEAQTTVTNHFGYFHLSIQRNHPYGVLIKHKRYKFSGVRAITYISGALIVIYTADPEQ